MKGEYIMVHRIDIPLGKALVPTEIEVADPDTGVKVNCSSCFFWKNGPCYEKMACRSQDRTDKKDVYYVLLDVSYQDETQTAKPAEEVVKPKRKYKRKTPVAIPNT
jgi:hypothetical protein